MNLNQVTIYTNKFYESLEFYKKLGLKIIVDSAPRYVRFVCPDGDSTFSLHSTEDDSVCSNIVLYFECDDLNGEVERLKISVWNLSKNRRIKIGYGAKRMFKTRMEIKFVFFTRAKIAKIRRGV